MVPGARDSSSTATSLTSTVGIDIPIVQAPMAGVSGPALALEVTRAGGLGSLPCAMLDPATVREQVGSISAATSGPINLNFFCHEQPVAPAIATQQWERRLVPYREELGLSSEDDPRSRGAAAQVARRFDSEDCELVEDLRPAVVSFHFGLPPSDMVERVHRAGCVILSSATTPAEAVWLEAHGCDVVVAQGAEAGGHRGMFLEADAARQISTMSLVPQVVDAVSVPVVAAGGIADARGVAAAIVLGAAGVQIGTGYLLCPENELSPPYRDQLVATDSQTVVTNVFSGRPARGIVNRVIEELGPMAADVAPFPLASSSMRPLRLAAERRGLVDFTPLWSGQSASLASSLPAGELTTSLWTGAADVLRRSGEQIKEGGGDSGRSV